MTNVTCGLSAIKHRPQQSTSASPYYDVISYDQQTRLNCIFSSDVQFHFVWVFRPLVQVTWYKYKRKQSTYNILIILNRNVQAGVIIKFFFYTTSIIMAAHSNGQAITFYRCGFYLFFFLLFSSPNLSGRRLDVYHTSTHDVVVALVQI